MDDEERRKLELPDRRKTTYADLEKKIDEHAEHLEERISNWIRRGLVAYAIIAFFCTVALIGFGFVLAEQQDTSDQLATLVDQNEQTAKDIQQQRADSTRISCENTNQRNVNTSAQLTALSKADEDQRKTEAGKKEVRRRRDVTLSLIDALSPVQNCDYLVDVVLGKVEPTPVPTPPKPTETP